LATFVVWTIVINARERRRQRLLADTRPPIDAAEFQNRLMQAGVEASVAQFVWDQIEPYYFAPLTPYPEDRPVKQFRIDTDDLSDMVTKFEKKFGRKWVGKWVGPDDPTLIEFAHGLLDSTSPR
jgi:hypothetical protein